MVLEPLIVFPLACLYGRFDEKENSSNMAICFSVLLLSIVLPVWLNVLNNDIEIASKRNSSLVIDSSVEKACEYIEELSTPEDRIVVYGNRNYIYLKCNRLPASKYSYQYPIANTRRGIIDEFFDDISKDLPKVFVVQEKHADERVLKFLANNGYEMRWKTPQDDYGIRVYSLQEE